MAGVNLAGKICVLTGDVRGSVAARTGGIALQSDITRAGI